MTDTTAPAPAPDAPPAYTPPAVWTWVKANGGRFASINRPIAGATHDKALPVGRHPLQLYSLGTPNGVKVTVMLEELLALGHAGAEYDAWLIRINEGEQFGSGFVDINPNSKIPALMDRSGPVPVRIFESGAILMHLAEKFGALLPTEPAARAECLSWLFWQMGSAPFLGGGFGHFYAYAPFKIEYAIDRYAMEVKRQLDVLDRRLADSPYLGGDDYTIADIAVWPWYGALAHGVLYGAGEFLQVQDYTHVQRWAKQIAQRPAVQRGRMVNRTFGEPSSQLHERHEASDFDTRTQDKLAAAPAVLIAAAELQQALLAPGKNLLVLDCSFDLADTEAGRRAYAAGHIPGACYVSLDDTLSATKTGRNGRHPLPARATFAQAMAALGANADTQIVAYDNAGGMYAARLWWMLRWAGHSAVRVLDGGIAAWKAAGGALETAASAARAPGAFPLRDSLVATVDYTQVLGLVGSAERLVVDARAPDRYRGENETLDPVGGHIPGAANRLFRNNLAADGRFKPAADLRAEFTALLGGWAPASVIHQCGSGVTACHNLLAMEVAGLGGAALYPGSWSEWCAQPGAPIATGPGA